MRTSMMMLLTAVFTVMLWQSFASASEPIDLSSYCCRPVCGGCAQ